MAFSLTGSTFIKIKHPKRNTSNNTNQRDNEYQSLNTILLIPWKVFNPITFNFFIISAIDHDRDKTKLFRCSQAIHKKFKLFLFLERFSLNFLPSFTWPWQEGKNGFGHTVHSSFSQELLKKLIYKKQFFWALWTSYQRTLEHRELHIKELLLV